MVSDGNIILIYCGTVTKSGFLDIPVPQIACLNIESDIAVMFKV